MTKIEFCLLWAGDWVNNAYLSGYKKNEYP